MDIWKPKRGSDKLARRQNPNRTSLSAGVLVRAAYLNGRGFPVDVVAKQMKVCPKALRTEFHRIGLEQAKPEHAVTNPNLELRMSLSRAERTTLGSAAIDHFMYQPAVAGILLRTVLAKGRDAVDLLIAEGRRQ